MKIHYVFLTLLLSLAGLSLNAASDRFPEQKGIEALQAKKVSRPSIALYIEADFKGRITRIKAPCEFANEIVMKSELGISNDTILSMKVPAGVRVTVFDGPNFNGDSATFTEGEHGNLGKLSHRVTSLKAEVIREQ